MSLPPTVAARRNARLRAAALATIPFLLFVVAAVPRLWAPDLAPFGERQAALGLKVASGQPISWWAGLTDPSLSMLAFVEPALRDLPSPMTGWVVLRGLVDALGVALLYLAARRLIGAFGGTLVALLYAASPIAWMAARDPAGPLWPALGAAALLVGVTLARRLAVVRQVGLNVPFRAAPTWLRRVLLGALALLVLYELVMLGLEMEEAEAAAEHRHAFTGRHWEGRQFPNRPSALRDVQAVVDVTRDVAGRIGTGEVVVLGDPWIGSPSGMRWPDALLQGGTSPRWRDAGPVLPLERETAYLFLDYWDVPIELERPSSTARVFTPFGGYTGARIVTLSPRSAVDWLARTQPVQDGRFADGSAVAGAIVQRNPGGSSRVSVFWTVPNERAVGIAFRPLDAGRGADIPLPPIEPRRPGELIVSRPILPVSTGVLRVTLFDAEGRPIPTASGAEALEIPLGAAPR